jgi:hypothetical protein
MINIFGLGTFFRFIVSPQTNSPNDDQFPKITLRWHLTFLRILFPRVTSPQIYFSRVTFPRISITQVSFPWISFTQNTFPRSSFPSISNSEIQFPADQFPKSTFLRNLTSLKHGFFLKILDCQIPARKICLFWQPFFCHTCHQWLWDGQTRFRPAKVGFRSYSRQIICLLTSIYTTVTRNPKQLNPISNRKSL